MFKSSTFIVVLLLIVIALLAWMLFVKSVEAPSVPVATTTPSETTAPPGVSTSVPRPLHENIVVTYPKANASVPKTFTVTGKAPGSWFFEAQAPVMVQTPDGEKIAQGTANAIGDWMTTKLVDFKADISVNPAYSGPATLVLLKDNPSGLPENDDSLEIPIVIQ